MKNIALCLIVKNEAHIIRRCIDSVVPFVSYVYVEDTGSTDNTPQVIRDHLAAKGIPGHVEETKWVSFCHNRSEALRRARQIPGIDYLLMIDADEVLVYQNQEVLTRIREIRDRMTEDCYHVQTRFGGLNYTRPQITSTKKNFYYRGVVHEFLACEGEFSSGQLDNIFNKPIQDSARNHNPQKYQDDAIALEEAIKTEQDPKMLSRYHFYCAQSWRDANNQRKALDYYQKAAKLCEWDQEKYYSLYQAGKLKRALNYPEEQVLITLAAATQVAGNRAEAAYESMKLCRELKWYSLGYAIGVQAIKRTAPKNALFSESWVYDYAMKDELSILAYWSNDFTLSLRLCEELIREKKYPQSDDVRIRQNLNYSQVALTPR